MLPTTVICLLGFTIVAVNSVCSLTDVPATPFLEWANAALKARLVEHLSTELKRTEDVKISLVAEVKDCQKLLNDTVEECRTCVRERCTARAESCSEVAQIKPNIKDVLREVTSKAISLLKKTWKKYLDVHVALANFARDAIKNIVSGLSDKLQSVKNEIIKGVQKTISKLTDTLVDVVRSFPDVLDGIGDLVGDLGHGLKNVFDAFGDVLNDVEDVVHHWGSQLGDIASDIGDGMKDAVKKVGDVVEDIADGIGNAVGNVADKVGDVVDKVADKAKDIADDVVDTVGNVGSKIGSAVGKVIGGISRIRLGLPRIRLRLPRIRIRLPRVRLGRGWKRRRRRSSEPTCEDLTQNTEEACMTYKSDCSACQELVGSDGADVMENVCGQDAVTAYLNLVSMDERTEKLTQVYRLYIELVTLLLRLQIDASTFDPQTASYRKVYATVNVGNMTTRYESSAAFSYANATTTGRAIGNEVWDMFWENGLFGDIEKFDNRQAYTTTLVTKSLKWKRLTGKLEVMAQQGLIRRRRDTITSN